MYVYIYLYIYRYIYIYIACFPGVVLYIFARVFSGLKTFINLLDNR